MTLTQGGSYTLRRQAEMLDKFIQGEFSRLDYYDKIWDKALLYGKIMDYGFVKSFEEHELPQLEVVFPNEILFDREDARDGNPRQMFRVKFYDRDVLMGIFPKHRTKIEEAPVASEKHLKGQSTLAVSDLVAVTEAWKLPSAPNMRLSKDDSKEDKKKKVTDGRRAIIIDNATLLHEEYNRPSFPGADYVWKPDLLGKYGLPLMADAYTAQLELDDVLADISIGHALYKSKLVVDENMVPAEWDDEMDSIVKVKLGQIQTPFVWQPANASPEKYRYAELIPQWAHEDSGLSQFDSQAIKPPGLESGKALRTHHDLTSLRHIGPVRRAEKLVVDSAMLIVDSAQRLYENGVDLETTYEGRDFIEEIKWSKLKTLMSKRFVMKVFPASALPDTPAERIDTLLEWVDRGWISSERAMELSEFPDIDAELKLRLAPRRIVERQLEAIIDEGRSDIVPEPYQPLDVALNMARNAYLNLRLEDGGAKAVKNLQIFISKLESLVSEAEAAALKKAQLAQAAAQGVPPPAIQPGAPTGAAPAEGRITAVT
jgi:hypothetical protein